MHTALRNGRNNKVSVGLVQINNSYSGQSYLPYSVGLLQAYVEKFAPNPDKYEFNSAIYSRLSPEVAVKKLGAADVVGFSAYVWNIRLSLLIAEKLKKESPETLIVFGGPQVPDRCEEFLKKHPFIDVAVHGEGEQPFLAILENLDNRKWEEVQSLSFLRPDGTFVGNLKAPRMADLSTVPSPYLSGVFDNLIAENPEDRWIVVWETNRGCPFSCTYCDWGSATQMRVYQFPMERLFAEVDWFAKHKVPFIFCADANFGILERDYDLAKKVGEVRAASGFPQTLSVQNTKNATDRSYRIQKLLADTGLTRAVTISYQSTDPETLKNIKRANISQKFFKDLQSRFASDRIATYTDIILGLPGETYESFANGVSQVIEDGQHNRIVFNNLSILPNAEMGDPEYQKKFGLETIQNEVVYGRGAINQHATDTLEMQDLVIATKSMPRPDWIKTRAFAWMTNFLHFLKTTQIPNIVLHESYGLNYREIIEIFLSDEISDLPILNEAKNFFFDKARTIQERSDWEFCPSEKWLGIYWPADEYLLIKLCSENKIGAFYAEAEAAVLRYLKKRFDTVNPILISDAFLLNRSLLKQPYVNHDISIQLSHDLWTYYQAIVRGDPADLKEGKITYIVPRTSQRWNSWDDWCREVVWYGNKNAAYLYPVNLEAPQTIEAQIAGHH